ncbi:MAG: chemotaxis protein [Xanthobacteraceae bacterium]|nr:chemotaxis protein [Xanthobacteraceae bacterium]
MPDSSLHSVAEGAIASIGQINSRIEGAFAEAGEKLGRGLAIFEHLNQGLAQLSTELSGTNMEGAAAAFQEIAANLTLLADALPIESSLLGAIGAKAAEASAVLKLLLKHIQMISIISRSARIEAASLEGHRESFLSFTQEAFDLAQSVQSSIQDCARDQTHLVAAVGLALGRQREFESRYRLELLSVGSDMTRSYGGLQRQQADAVRLATTTSANAERIARSVGISIVSLQAGDSMRQRLEHVCRGLRVVVDDEAPLAPDETRDASVADIVATLEADQLHDAIGQFDGEIRQIGQALGVLRSDVAGIVEQGRALNGGEGDGSGRSSFLLGLKHNLSQASALIASCEQARRSVDEALAVVEQTLGKFRGEVSELSQAVADIILIGMNAGLKAGHLGTKGSSFVVIANELQTTADHISAGTTLLKPILDHIEASAGELRTVRAAADSSRLASLEPSILKTVGEVEEGNDRLDKVIHELGEQGVEFAELATAAQAVLVSLVEKSAALPAIVNDLRAASGSGLTQSASAARAVPMLDQLYAQYTMVAERDVHRSLLRRVGLGSEIKVDDPKRSQEDADDVLFF